MKNKLLCALLFMGVTNSVGALTCDRASQCNFNPDNCGAWDSTGTCCTKCLNAPSTDCTLVCMNGCKTYGADGCCTVCNTALPTNTPPCDVNYYVMMFGGRERCSPCPSGGKSSGNYAEIGDCYLPAGTSFNDDSGVGAYTGNCYY